MRIYLEIGGQAIRLEEAEGRNAFKWPYWPMDLFETKSSGVSDIHVDVTVARDLPRWNHGNMIFDAGRGLWKLYDADDGYFLESLNTETHEPFTRSLISRDFAKVRLWAAEMPDPFGGHERGWVPARVINPVIEICLLTRIARQGGMLLHASAVRIGDEAYVFCGPSGSGKSTLSELFVSEHRATALSDEKIILRRQKDRFVVYGTPWYGSSHYAVNEKAFLKNFYLISHGQASHQILPLSRREWMSRILQESSFPYWDRQAMEETLKFLEDLSAMTGCQELSFLKDPSVCDFLSQRSAITAVNVGKPYDRGVTPVTTAGFV